MGSCKPLLMVTTRSRTPASSPERESEPTRRTNSRNKEQTTIIHPAPAPGATSPGITGRQPDRVSNQLGLEFGTSLSLADREALKSALREYKYVSPNSTLFEILFLNQLWEFSQRTFLPRWLAPNVVTFSGFVAIMISFVLMLWYSPELDGKCPSWWYAFTFMSCFFYQTMDGCDGKQARATKTGSPLGELFDHGVDALVTPIYVAFTIELQGFGIKNPIGLLAILLSQFAFYMSNLTLLHLGRQEFNRIDCQEVQVIIQLSLLLTVFYPEFWIMHIPLPFKNITWMVELLPQYLIRHVMVPDSPGVFYVRGLSMLWSTCCMGFNVLRGILSIMSQYFVHVSDSYEYTTQLTGKYMKEGQGIAAFMHQLCTMFIYVLFNFACWSSAASEQRITSNPWMPVCWLLLNVYTFGDLMSHCLFTRVGQLPFPQLPFRNRGAWLMFLFWVFFGHDEFVFVVVAVSILSHLQYCITMGSSVCDALKIKFFTIPYKP